MATTRAFSGETGFIEVPEKGEVPIGVWTLTVTNERGLLSWDGTLTLPREAAATIQNAPERLLGLIGDDGVVWTGRIDLKFRLTDNESIRARYEGMGDLHRDSELFK